MKTILCVLLVVVSSVVWAQSPGMYPPMVQNQTWAASGVPRVGFGAKVLNIEPALAINIDSPNIQLKPLDQKTMWLWEASVTSIWSNQLSLSYTYVVPVQEKRFLHTSPDAKTDVYFLGEKAEKDTDIRLDMAVRVHRLELIVMNVMARSLQPVGSPVQVSVDPYVSMESFGFDINAEHVVANGKTTQRTRKGLVWGLGIVPQVKIGQLSFDAKLAYLLGGKQTGGLFDVGLSYDFSYGSVGAGWRHRTSKFEAEEAIGFDYLGKGWYADIEFLF